MTIDPVYPQADEDGSCPDALIFIHRLIKKTNETTAWRINMFIISKRPPSTVKHLPSETLIEYLYRTQVKINN